MNPFAIGFAIGQIIALPFVVLHRLLGWKWLVVVVAALTVIQIVAEAESGAARGGFIFLTLLLWLATIGGAARILGCYPQEDRFAELLDFFAGPPSLDIRSRTGQGAIEPRPTGAVTTASQSANRPRWVSHPIKTGDVETARNELRRKVAGRETALATMLDHLETAVARTDRTRPSGVFVVVGEPGVGASHIARSFAEALRRPAVEIDLSVPDLTAAGLDELAACLPHFPSAIVVLDRADKLAVSDALIIATALRNDGFVEDVNRQRLPTRDAVFLLLVTARAKETLGIANAAKSAAERTVRLRNALEGAVPSDLLERADAVVHLGMPDAATLAALAAERLEAAASTKGVRLAHPAVQPEMLASLAAVSEVAMEEGVSLGATLDRFAVWADRALADARKGTLVRIDGDDPANPILVTVTTQGRA